MNIGESLVVKGGDDLEVLGQVDHREPQPRAEQRRQLVGPPLHHRPDLLHVGGAAGADGRSLAAADLREDEAAVDDEDVSQTAAACVVHRCAVRRRPWRLSASAVPAGGRRKRRRRRRRSAALDAALEKAARYLVAKQSADGAWRSETYGALRDGPSLTPLVMSALAVSAAGRARRASRPPQRGRLPGRLRRRRRPAQGRPARTALSRSIRPPRPAGCVVLVERSPRERPRASRPGWPTSAAGNSTSRWAGSRRIRSTAAGASRWTCPASPRRASPRNSCTSRTWRPRSSRWRPCGRPRCPAGDPAYAQALAFVKRCQNFSDDPAAGDPKFDDGGFFFIPGDAAQNKAGAAGDGSLRPPAVPLLRHDDGRRPAGLAPLRPGGGPSAGRRPRGSGWRGTSRRPTTPAHFAGRPGGAPGRDLLLLDLGGLARLSRRRPASGWRRRDGPVAWPEAVRRANCSPASGPTAPGSTASPTPRKTIRWSPRLGRRRRWPSAGPMTTRQPAVPGDRCPVGPPAKGP